MVASAQPMFTPGQAPLRTSTTASKVALPATVTAWLALVATKRYHTSSSALPVKPLQSRAGRLWVAPTVVPLVGVQVVAGVRLMAPAHSLLGRPTTGAVLTVVAMASRAGKVEVLRSVKASPSDEK